MPRSPSVLLACLVVVARAPAGATGGRDTSPWLALIARSIRASEEWVAQR